MTRKRKAAIRILTLRYLADHMQAVLDIDPGPHDLAETDDEDLYLESVIKDEAAKLRARANRTRL